MDAFVAEGPEMSGALTRLNPLAEVRVDAQVVSHGVLPPVVARVVVRVLFPANRCIRNLAEKK